MKHAPKFQIGDELYVREPARFIDNVTCIIGPVQSIEATDAGGWAYIIAAGVGRIGGYENPPEGQAMRFEEADLGLRLGTPISQLSGRPGSAGYERFKSIASSWGYE